MNELLKLYNSFNNIKYIDNGHKYVNTDTNEQYVSVTGVLGSLKSKFDTQFWKVYKSLEYSGYIVKDNKNGTITVNGDTIINPYFNDLSVFDLKVTPEDVLKQWSLASKIGTTRGSILHDTLENRFKRKELSFDIPNFINYLPAVEMIKYIKSVEILQNLADDFIKEIIKDYIVVAQEFVVGDSDYKLAGTFDLLMFNKNTSEYELWDFKTDKKFDKSSLNKLSYFGIDDCEMNKYSLQLGIYKNIIKKNSNLNISKCVIAHFNYKKNTYKIIEALNYDEEIKHFLENGKDKSAYF